MKHPARCRTQRIVLISACCILFLCLVPRLSVPNPVDEIQEVMEKGKALRLEGKYQKAAEAFSAVLILAPDNVEALVQLGVTQEDLKRPKLAAETYRRALEIDPHNIPARRNRDQLNSSREIQKPLQGAPRPGDGLLNRGLRELESQRFDRAVEIFELAGGLLVNDPRPPFYSAITRERQGLLNEATAQYERTLAAFPDYAPAWTNLVIALLTSGDREGARKRAQKALEIFPHDRRIRYLRLLTTAEGRPVERKELGAGPSGGRQEP